VEHGDFNIIDTFTQSGQLSLHGNTMKEVPISMFLHRWQ